MERERERGREREREKERDRVKSDCAQPKQRGRRDGDV